MAAKKTSPAPPKKSVPKKKAVAKGPSKMAKLKRVEKKAAEARKPVKAKGKPAAAKPVKGGRKPASAKAPARKPAPVRVITKKPAPVFKAKPAPKVIKKSVPVKKVVVTKPAAKKPSFPKRPKGTTKKHIAKQMASALKRPTAPRTAKKKPVVVAKATQAALPPRTKIVPQDERASSRVRDRGDIQNLNRDGGRTRSGDDEVRGLHAEEDNEFSLRGTAPENRHQPLNPSIGTTAEGPEDEENIYGNDAGGLSLGGELDDPSVTADLGPNSIRDIEEETNLDFVDEGETLTEDDLNLP